MKRKETTFRCNFPCSRVCAVTEMEIVQWNPLFTMCWRFSHYLSNSNALHVRVKSVAHKMSCVGWKVPGDLHGMADMGR